MCETPNLCAETRNSLTASLSPGSAEPAVFVVNADILECRNLEQTLAMAGWRSRTVSSLNDLASHARQLVSSCLVLGGQAPERYPFGTHMPMIFLAAQDDISATVRAMRAGAFDVLEKPVRIEALADVVRRALDFSTACLPQELERRELQSRYESLSQREREVMALVTSGLLNKQVGGRLGISEITVKAHRGKMMRKMKAVSLAALIKMADRLQLNAASGPH
jgi:FixJ family two-component response regulator